jgi:shikimate dehydrogenase
LVKEQGDDWMLERSILLGLIGAPIMHSASPPMHEAAGRATGFRVHYQLIEIPGADDNVLRTVLDGVRLIGFAGVNVTFPYKEAVLPLLDALDPSAASILAVNSIVCREGKLIGYNTDTAGFARAVDEEIAPLTGPVALIGAGGMGRAAAFALRRLDVPALRIFDKQLVRAERLAQDLGGPPQFIVCETIEAALADVVGLVNTTPVGMLPDCSTPVPPALLHAGLWVADVVYHPLITPLLRAADAAGARAITGRALTVHQAAEAFALFAGIRPPVSSLQSAFDVTIAAHQAA